jgi:hypothetical protein
MTSPADPPVLPPELPARLRTLATRWRDAAPAERANYQLYLIDLAEALGVERPRPAAGGDRVADAHRAYQFEYPVTVTTRDGAQVTNFIDLYKAGCFALEAKDADADAPAVRLLTKAFGQVANYARDLPERPPYIMVLDVGRTLLVWDRWSGTYGGFHLAQRIDLATLAERPADIALLRDIWTEPAVRDPRRRAQAITVEIAGLLGALAATLEQRGHEPEPVARFLMRCVFTMFAEDVRLLPDASFTRLLDATAQEPASFTTAVEALWRAMNDGALFGYHRLLRFNGHFFADATALPLAPAELALLRRAASADWSAVEPTIFGTLLVRALTPEERHRLGAEYTPRAFIERLVRPTVEEPVRARWAAVQAEVLQLRERAATRKRAQDRDADLREAERHLLEFHGWLRGLRILDPACGSGNFLYVTMHALKRVELEVFRALSEVHGGQLGIRMAEVDPSQFLGIEVKPWAREIAELTLWIGFHQFWRQVHGDVQPEEPLLRDTGTLECRDAVLAWDAIVHRPEKDRPDPTPRLVHPVTGALVPDPEARLPYYEYVGARAAEWPEADFIVGNPPYLGEKRQREALGDGYVDALRASYAEVTDSADLVTYWWHRAAKAVAAGTTLRAGLITTNTLTQSKNRKVIEQAAKIGARIIWAIANHPWVESTDGAQVRVTMTVLSSSTAPPIIVSVDEDGQEISSTIVAQINADLTADADVASAAGTKLRANGGISSQGFKLVGAGFVVEADEARRLIAMSPAHSAIVRPFRNGKDLSNRPRGVYVIDFGLCDEAEARAHPVLYDRIRATVMPERQANARESYRSLWWRFAEPRRELRSALAGLTRYIVTLEVSKHRFFLFVDSTIAPDGKLVCIASADAYVLGVLSSFIHEAWATAAGGRHGVGNDLVYSKSLCFSPFPFPHSKPDFSAPIAAIAQAIDSHRQDALARDERVTMTGIYNVIAKLRTGEPLTPKERTIHELAACGVLRDLHDELDALVARAYGWPWPLSREAILERLVALHAERVAEEARGLVRWLRPDYQAPGADAAAPTAAAAAAPAADDDVADGTVAGAALLPWPAGAIDQIAALTRLVAAHPLAPAEAAARFAEAPVVIVARHLETLALLGEVRVGGDGRYGGIGTA